MNSNDVKKSLLVSAVLGVLAGACGGAAQSTPPTATPIGTGAADPTSAAAPAATGEKHSCSAMNNCGAPAPSATAPAAPSAPAPAAPAPSVPAKP